MLLGHTFMFGYIRLRRKKNPKNQKPTNLKNLKTFFKQLGFSSLDYINNKTIGPRPAGSWTANVDFVQFVNFVDFDIQPTSHMSAFRGLCGFRFLGRPYSLLAVRCGSFRILIFSFLVLLSLLLLSLLVNYLTLHDNSLE